MKGKVYLVGAGPGDPELLTLKALRVLRSADVILYDELVAPAILNLASSRAELHMVGKRSGKKKVTQEEINFLLVALASAERNVVRLKGGDPLIFSRVTEEIEALRRANIEFEIVPGVTAGLAAAHALGIPLTDRKLAPALIFVSGHHAAENLGNDWAPFLSSGATLVIYMPGQDRAATARRLIESGASRETPCAIVSHATGQNQQTHVTNIQGLSSAPALPAPSLLIVGEVVRLADRPRAREAARQADLFELDPVTRAAWIFSSAEGRTSEKEPRV